MARVPLTRKASTAIRRLRLDRGLNQYELATELGWVRSKIKRLEKHEVQSVEEADLQALFELLGEGKDKPTPKEEGPPKRRVFPKGSVSAERALRRSVPGILFLDVVVQRGVRLDEMRGAEYEYNGSTYRVHGVEHPARRMPVFKRGEHLVLLLWQPASKGTKLVNGKKPRLNYEKADKGKPKPRLDYEEGTAVVLKALRTAGDQGHFSQERGEIERATGYTACQVRTFCKTLEKKGLLLRKGAGRGMRYHLLKDAN